MQRSGREHIMQKDQQLQRSEARRRSAALPITKAVLPGQADKGQEQAAAHAGRQGRLREGPPLHSRGRGSQWGLSAEQ